MADHPTASDRLRERVARAQDKQRDWLARQEAAQAKEVQMTLEAEGEGE